MTHARARMNTCSDKVRVLDGRMTRLVACTKGLGQIQQRDKQDARKDKTLKKSCDMPRIDPCVRLNLSFPMRVLSAHITARKEQIRTSHRRVDILPQDHLLQLSFLQSQPTLHDFHHLCPRLVHQSSPISGLSVIR